MKRSGMTAVISLAVYVSFLCIACNGCQAQEASGSKNGNETVNSTAEEDDDYPMPFMSDSKWGYEDNTGKEVIPRKYSSACKFSEGLAPVKLDGEWGFVDKTGKEVVPCKYDSTANFRGGLVAVELNNKWGFIDKTGKEVFTDKYAGVGCFSEELAPVGIGGGYYVRTQYGPTNVTQVDGRGNPLGNFTVPGSLGPERLVPSRWGFIDKTGKVVISCEYDGAGNFSEGLAAVKKQTYGWGFIN